MPRYGSQIDTQQIPIKGLTPETSGSAPPDPAPVQLWGDASQGPAVLRYWNGSAWVRANGADLPDGTVTDAKVASGAGIALSKLATDPLARVNHTGTQPSATIGDLAQVVQGYRLDAFAAPAAALDLAGQRITALAAPAAATDAATRQYVDDARAGIAGVKDPVRVVAQGPVDLTAPGASIDGAAMAAGDRFLARVQAVGTQNGLYTWEGADVPAVRAADAAATGDILDGTLVAVAEGTDAGRQYLQTATPSGEPGAWTQTWTVYNTSGTSYSAGAGLALTGNVFAVEPADPSIAVSGDGVTVGTVPVAKGGTGAADAADARAALGAAGRYAADLPALPAGVWVNVTHGLGSLDVTEPAVRDTATGEFVLLDAKTVDADTVAVRADVGYAAGVLRVAVVG